MDISRRTMMQFAAAAVVPGRWQERKDTPKICLDMALARGIEDGAMRRLKQIGVDYVLSGGPPMPWTEDVLRKWMTRLKEGGRTLGNLMIGVFDQAQFSPSRRDAEIEKAIKSVRAAGKAGLPVVEYNCYAHRIVEGYYEEKGRAGAGLTAFDYERVKNLPPLTGIHGAEEVWENLTYFLKAVIPVAVESGVRMALHPNDPPSPLARGSVQPMGTLAGWKRMLAIVDSPANGITFDCGVTKEMGEDPVSVCRFLGSKDRINHVHFRNVKVRKPYEQYTEVFLDEGEVDMFGVMKELVRQKYPRLIYPEHPRGLDYDRERADFKTPYPGGGGYAAFSYNVGYARAMLQAALGQ